MTMLTRRTLLKGTTAAGLVFAAPAISYAAGRPVVTHGVQSGDVGAMSGVIWARADRPAKAQVEIATTESFADARRLAPTPRPAGKRLRDEAPADRPAVGPGHLLPCDLRAPGGRPGGL